MCATIFRWGIDPPPGGRVSGSDVALSGASVPCGAWVLAGNAGVAALLPGGAVGTVRGVSVGSAPCVVGLGVDVAVPARAGTVATTSPGVGVCSPQASRAARIKIAGSNRVLSIFLAWPQHYGVPVRHVAFPDNRPDRF